ncbi:MAG TPA: helix-turn-helix domain-containing protein [Actinomycetota bacterium]|jgi:excisionase family DNA binding protein
MHHQGTALPAGQGTSGRVRRSPVAFTVAEFAALLGKHPNTVYDWIRKGQIPFERIGNSYFIPERALGRLRSPAADDAPVAAGPGGEAA